ncbi:MAG: DNA alkylation repair protein [Saprospiraceae bacterium]|nr:DNA alkylation repair protein [Saprospiraceae bacterium]
MDVLTPLVESFRKHADDANARAMQAYMKDRFVFLGLKSPLRKQLQKEILTCSKNFEPSILLETTQALWRLEEREFQYVACDLLRRRVRTLSKKDVGFLEQLVLDKSWWDTVDSLAGTIGDFLLQYPSLQPESTDAWIKSEEMWLQRVALIHQLKYREHTDWAMMQRYVLVVANSREFFLQKGAGWALRQYSKFFPDKVRDLLREHTLMPLTVREASKYL